MKGSGFLTAWVGHRENGWMRKIGGRDSAVFAS
jgi:hypothetical protein